MSEPRREVKCGNLNCEYFRWSDEPCPECGYDPRTSSEKLASLRKAANKLRCSAKSSPSPRFDLIPREALVRLAQRYERGLERYGKNNWREGVNNQEYILERLAHAVGHLYALMDQVEGRLAWSDEDHAAALIWAGAFACEATRALQEQEVKSDPSTMA